jgi:rsbT co-antagonist protein RsbR
MPGDAEGRFDMEDKAVATPQLDADSRSAMREYWQFYEPHSSAINQELIPICERMPDFGPVIRAMTAQQLAEQNERSLALQRAAILDDKWGPYLADLRQQGMHYASRGISFASWFETIAAYRECTGKRLALIARESMQRATTIAKGMNRHLDIAMAEIGEAYVAAKEGIIHEQQVAILELSTPVLQIRERLLLLPIIGIIDTRRAQQITESVLRSVRSHRAKVVVMDVTGVATIDSKVANHIMKAVNAARLMGAQIIVTGLSSEVAQSLVSLGVELTKLNTVGDLQGGLEEAERMLGYRVSRSESLANGVGES